MWQQSPGDHLHDIFSIHTEYFMNQQKKSPICIKNIYFYQNYFLHEFLDTLYNVTADDCSSQKMLYIFNINTLVWGRQNNDNGNV